MISFEIKFVESSFFIFLLSYVFFHVISPQSYGVSLFKGIPFLKLHIINSNICVFALTSTLQQNVCSG